MKKTLSIVAQAALAITVLAQQKSLSSTVGVYVFPQAGQNASMQSQDESQCYSWAVQNTGSDPFELQKQQQAQQQQAATATQGSAVRGAARGAAGGALIGGIAGDAGKGAAIGAATGAVVNRSRARRAQESAESSAAATGAQIDNFKKAFSVCLEGKKYLVKY
jgi:hypothetical protein